MARMIRRGMTYIAILAVCLASATAAADARSEFLIRMLSTSSQFRVRAQAALGLGSQTGDKAALKALISGLRDEHPAVRAACAAALERLGDTSAIPALKEAQDDRDGAVRTAVRSALSALERVARPKEPEPEPSVSAPSGPATYYVAVGLPATKASVSKKSLRALREHVAQQVAQMSGVLMAPENEDPRAAERVLKAQKLVGFYIESSITTLEEKPDGSIRAQVSVIVATYPGRDIRAMLSGAATLSGGGSDEDAKVQAIQAAYTGALRRLPQALQAGLARAQ